MCWLKGALVVLALVGVASAYPEGRALELEGRVVNGTNSNIERYPFMVSLRSSSGSHSCGASIIAPRFILTAAHCTSGRAASSITIQYGQTTISTTGSTIVGVKKIHQHENYSPLNNYANDIALLELNQDLVFNYKNVAPVQLPAQDFEIEQVTKGAPGVLAGWGLNATGGIVQKHLQEVNLKIFSDAECNKRHNGKTNGKYHICGGVDEGGKGQCSGDSGGPLLLNGRIQLGVVSWSVKPCAVYPYPGVYTKVSKYINWINKKMSA